MPELLSHIAAGNMDVRATFQRPSTIIDPAGGQVTRYEDDFPAWVEITPQTGREVIVAQRLEGEITHTVKCRARRDKTPYGPGGAPAGVGSGGTVGVNFGYRIKINARRDGDLERYLDIDHILDSYEQGAVWIIRCVERPNRATPPAPEGAGDPEGTPA